MERPCFECKGACCKQIAIEIDKPTTKREYDHIRWYLMHKNVNVYIDHDNKWFVEFDSLCEYLDESGKCEIYNSRPKICRDYPPEDYYCIYESKEPPYKIIFKSHKEFEKYLENKNIDWKYKIRKP